MCIDRAFVGDVAVWCSNAIRRACERWAFASLEQQKAQEVDHIGVPFHKEIGSVCTSSSVAKRSKSLSFQYTIG